MSAEDLVQATALIVLVLAFIALATWGAILTFRDTRAQRAQAARLNRDLVKTWGPRPASAASADPKPIGVGLATHRATGSLRVMVTYLDEAGTRWMLVVVNHTNTDGDTDAVARFRITRDDLTDLIDVLQEARDARW